MKNDLMLSSYGLVELSQNDKVNYEAGSPYFWAAAAVAIELWDAMDGIRTGWNRAHQAAG